MLNVDKIDDFWTRVAKNKQTFENRTVKMRNCSATFSRLLNAERKLAWSVFHVFYTGFQRCKSVYQKTHKCTSCRSRQELSHPYILSTYNLLAKFGVDTAENGRLKVCQKMANS